MWFVLMFALVVPRCPVNRGWESLQAARQEIVLGHSAWARTCVQRVARFEAIKPIVRLGWFALAGEVLSTSCSRSDETTCEEVRLGLARSLVGAPHADVLEPLMGMSLSMAAGAWDDARAAAEYLRTAPTQKFEWPPEKLAGTVLAYLYWREGDLDKARQLVGANDGRPVVDLRLENAIMVFLSGELDSQVTATERARWTCQVATSMREDFGPRHAVYKEHAARCTQAKKKASAKR